MADEKSSLEERIEQLAAGLQALTLRVEQLAARQERMDVPVEAQSLVAPAAAIEKTEEYPLGEPVEVAEEILTWAGKASLLQRMATLCFLLVIALILRTITDSGLINTLVGSALGMSYAAILIIVGWHMYRRQSPLAPVFAACGAVLISTIVVETHAHFQSLPLVPAYFTLMVTGAGMGFISYQNNAFVPVSVGTLSMCLAGVAIDYPNPFFPYLAMVLLTANWLGFYAAQLKRCAWLRWILLLVTLVMLQLWGFKLGIALHGKLQVTPALAASWFLPSLAIFAVAYLAIALLGIVRSGNDKISRFDFSLPTINAVWIFAAAQYLVSVRGQNLFLLGLAGIIVALGFLAVAFWLAQRKVQGAPGVNSFAFAAAALLAFALPAVVGNVLFSLAALSLFAVFLLIMSRQWRNGAVRATSYLLQAAVCAASVILLWGNKEGSLPLINVIPAAIMTGANLIHYRWCRQQPPPADAAYFTRFDKKDRTAGLMLLASLACGFFMLRIGMFQALQLTGKEMPYLFGCAQSVLINGAAIALMALALVRRNKEIRNAAILVTVIGAVKVFLYDLLGAHGVPLVFSIFSFGLAAALESVALGRWQRMTAKGEDQ